MSVESTSHPRVAIIGTEHGHSFAYQQTLAHTPVVEVVAILDDGGRVLSDYEQLPRYHHLDDLLADETFEAAIALVPAHRAEATLTALIEAGKHVLCDKPVCRTASEMQRVAAAARRQDVRFATGYVNRFRPVHQLARRLVREGALGRLYALEAHLFTADVAARGGPDHYLFRRAEGGGGILSWLGCHIIDMMLDLTGEAARDVQGLLATLGGVEVDVEDVASLAFRFEGGALASLLAGYTLPREPDDPTRLSRKDTWLSLWGSEAKLEFEPFGKVAHLTRYHGDPERPVRESHSLPYAATPGYLGSIGRDMILDFVDAVRNRRTPRADQDAALRVLEILDAAYAGRAEAAG